MCVCVYIYIYIHIYIYTYCCLVSKSYPTPLQPRGLYPARLPCPWGFPGKNTGVGCHFLFQVIFLTQASNSTHVSCIGRWILYTESPGKPIYTYMYTYI